MKERVWIVQIYKVVELGISVTGMTSFRKEAFLQKIRNRALLIFLIALQSDSKPLLASTLLI